MPRSHSTSPEHCHSGTIYRPSVMIDSANYDQDLKPMPSIARRVTIRNRGYRSHTYQRPRTRRFISEPNNNLNSGDGGISVIISRALWPGLIEAYPQPIKGHYDYPHVITPSDTGRISKVGVNASHHAEVFTPLVGAL